MERKLKRRLAIGGAVLATFGAAGGAYALASGSNNERDAYLNDLAGRLHVSRQQLDSALKGAFEDRLDAAVKAGRLTQAEADAIKKKVEQGGGAPRAGGPFFGPGRFFFGGPRPGFGLGLRPFGAGFDAAARYLGLTDAQLRQQLMSGKSLATIAGDKNKSVPGLEQAIKNAVKSKLDSAVSAKDITQEQENNILNELNSRLDDLVNLTPPKIKALRLRKGPFLRHGAFRAAPGPPPGGVPIF